MQLLPIFKTFEAPTEMATHYEWYGIIESNVNEAKLLWEVDEEVALESRNDSSVIYTWGNIDDVRDYQQEAYTRELRTRPKRGKSKD